MTEERLRVDRGLRVNQIEPFLLPRNLMNTIAIDTETTGPSLYHGCEAFMLTACDTEGSLYCWQGRVDPLSRKVYWKRKDILEMITVFSEYDAVVYHNATFDMRALDLINEKMAAIVHSKIVDDTLIQSHIVNSAGSHGLKDLAIYYLNILDDDEAELKQAVTDARTVAASQLPHWLIGSRDLPSLPNYKNSLVFSDYWLPAAVAKELNYSKDHPWHTVCQTYAERDVERTIVLHRAFHNYFEQQKLLPIYHAHREVIRTVKSIKDGGFHFFKNKAEDAIEQLQHDIKPYHEKIVEVTHADFNINSPKQLCELLYDTYELPIIKVTDKGSPSTDADALQQLLTDFCNTSDEYADAKILLDCILNVRARETTCSYINNYLSYAIEYKVTYDDESILTSYYLHPSLNQTGTSTTRFSCSTPNSQNISKGREDEDDEGNKIRVFNLRELFGPPPGYKWCAIDYKSLQLIIFAYESGDQGLIETFLQGGDPHNYVACGLFETDAPTDLERRVAKNVNYALIFGAGDRKLDLTAGRVGVKDLYKKQFPSTDRYMQSVIREARKTGRIHTAWGYPLEVSADKAYKGVNYIIQGDEGEIVKRAMVNTHQFLSQEHPACKLIMQIHDELIFEYPDWYDFPVDDIKSFMMKPAADIGWVTPVDVSFISEHWGKKDVC